MYKTTRIIMRETQSPKAQAISGYLGKIIEDRAQDLAHEVVGPVVQRLQQRAAKAPHGGRDASLGVVGEVAHHAQARVQVLHAVVALCQQPG